VLLCYQLTAVCAHLVYFGFVFVCGRNNRHDHSVHLLERITTTSDKHVDTETRYAKMNQYRVPDKEGTNGTSRAVLEQYSNDPKDVNSRVRIDLSNLELYRDACTTGFGQVSFIHHSCSSNVLWLLMLSSSTAVVISLCA
jgi:hypothetical protein